MGRQQRFRYWLVLISGPPRVGKSRAGTCLSQRLGADHFALSDLLKRLTHEHFELDLSLAPHHFEEHKDQPRQEFGGLTPREAYIMYSETVLKPRHGNDHLGQCARQRVAGNRESKAVSVVSGVGFLEEISPLVEEADARHTLHIRVQSTRETTAGDSRETLELAKMGIEEVEMIYRGCGQFLAALELQLPGICLDAQAGAPAQIPAAATERNS